MVSATVNALRWSALAGGIAYGFLHNRSLATAAEARHAAAEYAHNEKLIATARAKYAALHPKKDTGSSFDLEDPNADFVGAIEKALA